MQSERLIAFHEMNLVAVRLKKTPYVIIAATPEDRGSADLISVQVEDRQHRAVTRRVQEFVRVPARGQRAGLGFAVPDDAGDDQVRIVERGSISVGQ
jgi:hypothetical protein